MTFKEYQDAMAARAEAVSVNRSRRMKGLAALPLPPRPERPKVRVAYEPDGTYIGRLTDEQEPPAGAIVKMEPAYY